MFLVNNNMTEKGSTVSMWFKIGFYFFASLLIGFEAQIDNIQNMDAFKALDWIKLAIKSVLPAVIAMKAFFDTSVSNYFKKDDSQ
jgi:hypothetical protein